VPKTYSARPGRERLEPVSCPLCGGRGGRLHLEGEGFRFLRCCGCGLVYQSPQPLFADLRHRYSEGYFHYELENEENFFNLMRLGLRDARFERLAAGLGPPRRFLDIGCATGRLLAEMRDAGWQAQGVEICAPSAEYARRHRGLEVYVGPLEEAAFPGESFAVVHFSHLIEHVPDPRALLLEVNRILVPGGYALVTTPNVDGFQARLFGRRWRSAIADHLTLFSRRTLRRLLEQTGYRVLRTRTWGGLARGSAPQWLKRPADRLVKRLGCGDVVLMVAQKLTPRGSSAAGYRG
jgi:SAM-dependent methyltransferase